MNINSIVFDKNYDSTRKKIADLFIFKSAKTPKVSQILQKKLELMECFCKDLIFQISSTIERALGIKNVPLSAAKICTNNTNEKIFRKYSIPVPKFRLLNKSNKIKLILNFRLS